AAHGLFLPGEDAVEVEARLAVLRCGLRRVLQVLADRGLAVGGARALEERHRALHEVGGDRRRDADADEEADADDEQQAARAFMRLPRLVVSRHGSVPSCGAARFHIFSGALTPRSAR